MTEHHVPTRAGLLADIQRHWDRLTDTLGQLTELEMTAMKDEQGWTVKDHVVHLASWERSVVFFLQNKPRHAGLGVDEDLYLDGSYDEINASIQQLGAELPLEEALAQLREVHRQMLELLEPLTDAQLARPYRYYLPDEPGDGDGPPALSVVYGNTAHHFSEHQRWIELLVGRAQ
jgi:hypothetical protein